LWDMDASFGHYINYSNVPNITPQASPCDVLDNSVIILTTSLPIAITIYLIHIGIVLIQFHY